jgi:hypothetical protein
MVSNQNAPPEVLTKTGATMGIALHGCMPCHEGRPQARTPPGRRSSSDCNDARAIATTPSTPSSSRSGERITG